MMLYLMKYQHFITCVNRVFFKDNVLDDASIYGARMPAKKLPNGKIL